MKKLLFLLLSVFLCISCSDDNTTTDEPTPNPGEPQIEIPATSLTPNFKSEGGESTIEFTAKSDWSVSVVNTRAESWCSVSPLSGKAGKASLTIRTAANETYDERNATITLRAGTDSKNIIVTQKQKDALLVSSSKIEMKKEGGEFTIEVKANVTFSHSIDEGTDWISAATADTRGLTTTQLKFSVSANTSVHKREAGITVTDGTLSERITVYQEGEEPQLTATASQQTFGPEGGTLKIEINSNVDYETLLPDASWITEDQARNQSTHTLYFTISPNETYDNRQADIVFKDKESELADTVRVMQLQKDALVFSDEVIQVPGEENRLKIRFRRNIDFKVDVTANWITQVDNPETRSLQTDSVYFVILANPDYESERTCQIIFSSLDEKIEQRITIVQEAGMPEESEDEKELRKALTKIYNDCNGVNWDGYSSWNRKNPVNEWRGVKKLKDNTYEITLDGKYLTGKLELDNCKQISKLFIDVHNYWEIDTSILLGLQSIYINNCINFKNLYCKCANYDENPTLVSQLEEINIQNCPLFDDLSCEGNIINKLTLKECPKLKSIFCQYNNLVSLDLSGCKGLEVIRCMYNKFTDLTIDGHPSLKSIEINNNPELNSLSIKKCNVLKYLDCGSCNLSSLIIEECNSIEKLYCYYNKLTNLTLQCPKLSTLYCPNNLLESLTVSGELKNIDCRNNMPLSQLVINSSTVIEDLICYDNPSLKELIINADIKIIECMRANLSNLDLSQCLSLEEVDCRDNPKLKILNIDNCKKLQKLDCRGTVITRILPEWLYDNTACIYVHSKYQYITYSTFNPTYGDKPKIIKQDYGWWRAGEPNDFPAITLTTPHYWCGEIILPDGSVRGTNWIANQ